jgi:basic membrane protein A
MLKEIMELRSQGILGGRSFVANLANGGEVMAFNPEIDIPDDVKAAAEQAIAEIKAGGVSESPEIKPLEIAIVSPSSINDFAFTQSIHDAMLALQDEYGEDTIDFVYSENMFIVDDAAAAIRDYAASGYNMVIAHGSQYGSSLQEIAPDFPEVSFAWGTTVDTFGQDNIYAYEAASHEGGYVNGVMAAMLTESKVIGVVGPVETGDAKLYVDGFVAGVKATDPEIEVLVTYINNFSDVALAAETAETQIAAGADVLTGTAQMVVGAIGKIQENGGYWFGTQADQADFAPDTVVASQVYHWEVILREMIGLRSEGTLGGQSFVANLANGGQVMAFNPNIDIPEEVMEAAQATIQGIIDGTITIELP